MERRSFLQTAGVFVGGAMASAFIPAKIILPHAAKIKGRVHSKGKGIEGVVVSDGYSVMATDKKGKFKFDIHPDAIAVFMSTPSGYEFINEAGIARHYRPLSEVNDKTEVEFDLTPLAKSDNDHRFIIWADPQVKNAQDVAKMMTETVPDVQKLLQGFPSDTLVHGITVGDIVWDELKLFDDYNKAVQNMRIPFFQCLGNHDMDYRKGGDETSDDSFQLTYGPTYYSFNRGQVHYAVMDNVRYLGTERDYDGFLQQHQLDWLQKDLSFVPQNKMIVLCMHIPVHSGTKNKEALYSILGTRNVHIMSGHTHYLVNAIRDTIYEHNHGTVCGAWWTGPICEDGTPCGYGVYDVKGTELSWFYKSTGQPVEHQMRIHMVEFDPSERQAIVNIWNHDPAWKTEYWIDGVSKGPLRQFQGYDPQAHIKMLGPDLPKPRGFAEPRLTGHLFKAQVPKGAKEFKVVATDRFGKEFSATQTMTV